MPRHRMKMTFDVDIASQEEAQRVIGMTNGFLQQIGALMDPKPQAEIEPVDEPVGDAKKDPDLVVPPPSKLIIPGSNGHPPTDV